MTWRNVFPAICFQALSFKWIFISDQKNNERCEGKNLEQVGRKVKVRDGEWGKKKRRENSDKIQFQTFIFVLTAHKWKNKKLVDKWNESVVTAGVGGGGERDVS